MAKYMYMCVYLDISLLAGGLLNIRNVTSTYVCGLNVPRRLTVSKLLTVTVFPENKRKNFAEMRVPESIITNQPFPELKRIKALEAVRSGGLCVSFQ